MIGHLSRRTPHLYQRQSERPAQVCPRHHFRRATDRAGLDHIQSCSARHRSAGSGGDPSRWGAWYSRNSDYEGNRHWQSWAIALAGEVSASAAAAWSQMFCPLWIRARMASAKVPRSPAPNRRCRPREARPIRWWESSATSRIADCAKRCRRWCTWRFVPSRRCETPPW
jgi:hypothetical protein